MKERRRRRLRSTPLPPEWREIIERNVPYYLNLSATEQAELCGHVQVFLNEKRFEGCGGLEITDEMRVTIAAQACMLLLGRETDYFSGMCSVLVYPGSYYSRDAEQMPDGSVMEIEEEYTGESWERGPVVLSWDEVLASAADPGDGYNVVFHEFAHQLDGESGEENGAPVLPDDAMYAGWAEVMGREFERLKKAVELHRPHLIDEYAITSPAEFFAVLTETFFEMPREFARRHPETYGLLVRYYGQDPAARPSSRGRTRDESRDGPAAR